MCFGIVRMLARLLSDVTNDQEKNTSKAGDKLDSDDEVIHSDDEEDTHRKNDNDIDNKSKLIALRAELGIIYIPDTNNILVPSTSLTYDDAPWISRALGNNRGIVRFVNRNVSNETAKILGVRSLREQLLAGDDIVCPSASVIGEKLGSDTMVDAICDIIAVGDTIGARCVHVIFDERSHLSESLMHPGLTETQGPAVVIFFEGIVLSSVEMSQLMTFPTDLYDMSLAVGVGGAHNVTENTEHDIKYPCYGKRMNSAFAITDCLQVLSGQQFLIYDPCGKYWLGGPEGEMDVTVNNKSTSGKLPSYKHQQKAKKYSLFGKNNENIIDRFPDQFAPFLSLTFGDKKMSIYDGKAIHGSFLRMPLRTEASILSRNIYTDSHEVVKSSFQACLHHIEGQLLFSRGLDSITLQHTYSALNTDINSTNIQNVVDMSSSTEFVSITRKNSREVQNVRKTTIGDKNWKKSVGLLTAMFKQPAPPAEAFYNILTCVKHGISSLDDNQNLLWFRIPSLNKSTTSQVTINDKTWLVWCKQIPERYKSLALKEQYRALNVLPFVSAAIYIGNDQIENRNFIPEIGHIYSSGSIVCSNSGLPFHIEGTFLQVIF
jgi:hypothetical protein